jgi:hypothetical protein
MRAEISYDLVMDDDMPFVEGGVPAAGRGLAGRHRLGVRPGRA